MKKVWISQRLRNCAELIPGGATVADIGADRGELSYELLSSGQAERLIVSDISQHCLERACRLFEGDPLRAQVDFRLGDGLSVLRPGEAQAIVIAGIGGITVSRMLEPLQDLLPVTLVVQPMTDVPHVRRRLVGLGLAITDERFCCEDGHYYTVLRAEPGTMRLNDFEAEVGPILLKRQEPLLAVWLAEQQRETEILLSHLTSRPAAQTRCTELRRRLHFLKELTDAYRSGHFDGTQ